MGGGLIVDIRGGWWGNAKERVSRFWIFQRSASLDYVLQQVQTLSLLYVVHLTINYIFHQLPAFSCYSQHTTNDTLHK